MTDICYEQEVAAIGVSGPAPLWFTFGYQEINDGCTGIPTVNIYSQCKLCLDCTWSITSRLTLPSPCRGCSRKRVISEMDTTLYDNDGNGIRHMTAEEVSEWLDGKETIQHNEMTMRFEDADGNYILFYNGEASERIAAGDLVPDVAHNQLPPYQVQPEVYKNASTSTLPKST